jgi:hypothetical protein
VLDVEARTVRAGDEDRFGQLDRQLEVVGVAVEQFGLELEGRVVRSLEQLGLLLLDPCERRHHDRVGIARKVGDERLDRVGIGEGQRGRPPRADPAAFEIDLKAVGLLAQVGQEGGEPAAQAIGFAHGRAPVSGAVRLAAQQELRGIWPAMS